VGLPGVHSLPQPRNRYTAAPSRRPAKNDMSDHFFNVVSLVIGVLVVVAVAIFAFPRIVGRHTQDLQQLTDPDYTQAVAARIAPLSQEAIAGHDDSAPAAKPAAGQATGSAAPAGLPTNGKEVFEQVCSSCHGQGIAGAPKAGDKAAWAQRIAEGKPILYSHALQGYSGGPSGGVMPPKGGRADLADDLIKQSVDYMVQMAQ
jgi:cytochrome c5